MRIYWATTNDRDLGFAGETTIPMGEDFYTPHVLLSYHYFKRYLFEKRFDEQFPTIKPKLFCDSGAFSAKTLNSPITIKEYGDWLFRYKDYFDIYANLDVIGDNEGTDRNQKTLEDRGLTPIPVFHVGTDFEVLERLVTQYSYIALGGLVPHKTNLDAMMKYLYRCFEIARDSGREIKYHGFGLTSWAIIRSFPFYSVDSSSWNKGVMFGQFSIFNPKLGKMETFEAWNKKSVLKYARQIREQGFDPYMFIDKTKYKRSLGCRFDAIAWAKAGLWLTKFWKQDDTPYRWKTSGAPDRIKGEIAI